MKWLARFLRDYYRKLADNQSKEAERVLCDRLLPLGEDADRYESLTAAASQHRAKATRWERLARKRKS